MSEMMTMQFKKRLPVPLELKSEYPLGEDLAAIKRERDRQIADIFLKKDKRLLLIIGPCSADREDAVLDYMKRLSAVGEKVKDKIFIIPRLYTNKPRSIGYGYKGLLHQPDPTADPDLFKGIITVRKLNLKVLEETGFTCADEMLYPEIHRYVSDLLSYVAIGARSVEDQQHRMTASGVGIPVGMKNPTSGNLSILANSIVTAQTKQNFIYRNWDVSTPGNPFAHAILRGYETKGGKSISNYGEEHLNELIELLKLRNVQSPACVIDCNHANSGKRPEKQAAVCRAVIKSRKNNAEIHDFVLGFMVESYLEGGAQSPAEGVYGKSITDPCLGWKDTEKLIYELAEKW